MNQPAQTVPRKAVTPSRFALSWTAAAALAALSTGALAQEAAKGAAKDIAQLDTVVVTGVKASLV